ncbi:glycosyltransferase family 2 protein [Bacteroides salyersiae]|uniref:glycosyltransferase family 2 protein n=1 Tax=Bacteroides salyersiae TaxID=291644 RepID=UPI001C393E2D|nr:glycosyltransferase family 2 protein [Bacteroides salyersiae]MBV4203420.1 glycosyltransferase family 2 protein [Bacteroides salyersiae]MCB6648612.1 glycosyltransferase family 2 protein [Bacteroides salyersiae]
MVSTSPQISIISPIYKGEEMLSELVSRIKSNIIAISENFEIILVNDASPDNSWQLIQYECNKDERVKGINLSRNFGQHYAITAGLNHALGEWIVVMDCDLQDRPEEIPNLYKKAQEGYDIVLAQRTERQDSFFKRMSSALFYSIFSYLTDTKQDKSIANFGIFNQKAIRALLSMNDAVRYFPTMIQWVGFQKSYLPVVHAERKKGSSSYNLHSLLRLAFDNILGFSNKPLRLTVKLGFMISVLSLCLAVFYLIRYLYGNIAVSGFTTIVLSLWFIFGVTICLLGVLGLYIGRIFDQVKGRPHYIVQQTLNIN